MKEPFRTITAISDTSSLIHTCRWSVSSAKIELGNDDQSITLLDHTYGGIRTAFSNRENKVWLARCQFETIQRSSTRSGSPTIYTNVRRSETRSGRRSENCANGRRPSDGSDRSDVVPRLERTDEGLPMERIVRSSHARMHALEKSCTSFSTVSRFELMSA